MKCKSIINIPVPVNNDIPYPSHFMYLFLHYRTDNPLVDKMQKDVLIFTGNSECKIGIKDGTDIEYILNSKFNPLVDRIFYKTQIPEFFRAFW